MPQATPELREKWGIDDVKAWKQLEPNFKDCRGEIVPRNSAYKPTEEDLSAIAFLVHEWDYAYDVLTPRMTNLLERIVKEEDTIMTQLANTPPATPSKSVYVPEMATTVPASITLHACLQALHKLAEELPAERLTLTDIDALQDAVAIMGRRHAEYLDAAFKNEAVKRGYESPNSLRKPARVCTPAKDGGRIVLGDLYQAMANVFGVTRKEAKQKFTTELYSMGGRIDNFPYAYTLPDWNPVSCPCCGKLGIEDSVAGPSCANCGLPVSEWQRFMYAEQMDAAATTQSKRFW